jgi:hypothetical protein
LALGPRLSIATVTELHVLTSELSSLELIDTPDFRDNHLTNKKFQTKVSMPILPGICILMSWPLGLEERFSSEVQSFLLAS